VLLEPGRLRVRVVSAMGEDVARNAEARAEMSASAHLRQTQQGLAASQADLSRVERDLSITRDALGEYAALYESATSETARVERERDGVRAELARQAAENEDLAATLAMRTAQLGGSRAEREELRERLVSARAERDEARHCWSHTEFQLTRLLSQVAHLAVERNALAQQLDVVLAAETSPPDPGAGPREEQTHRRSTVTEIEKYAVDLVQIGAADCAQDDMNENGDISDEDWPTARNLGREMAAAIRRNQESFLAWYRSVDGGSHPDGA
jgi:chromosome segregation ATPase